MIAATDSDDVQVRLSQVCRALDILVIFPGLHKAALSGEVFVGYPDGTCFQCMTKRGVAVTSGMGGSDKRDMVNYGTGQLSGVMAVGCDIMPVVSLTAKIILGITCALKEKGSETPSPLAQFGDVFLTAKGTRVAMVHTSHYPLALVESLINEGYTNLPPSMYSYGHFWIKESRLLARETCDCCGTSPVSLNQRHFFERGELAQLFIGGGDVAPDSSLEKDKSQIENLPLILQEEENKFI